MGVGNLEVVDERLREEIMRFARRYISSGIVFRVYWLGV
jgi:hypothetical protein